jgi:hypothetical protein
MVKTGKVKVVGCVLKRSAYSPVGHRLLSLGGKSSISFLLGIASPGSVVFGSPCGAPGFRQATSSWRTKRMRSEDYGNVSFGMRILITGKETNV